MHQKGKELAVLVAPQMQQVAVLDVAPYRHSVPSHTYRPRVSAPQVLPATLFSALIAVTLALIGRDHHVILDL
jgi:hypothetical protein